MEAIEALRKRHAEKSEEAQSLWKAMETMEATCPDVAEYAQLTRKWSRAKCAADDVNSILRSIEREETK